MNLCEQMLQELLKGGYPETICVKALYEGFELDEVLKALRTAKTEMIRIWRQKLVQKEKFLASKKYLSQPVFRRLAKFFVDLSPLDWYNFQY